MSYQDIGKQTPQEVLDDCLHLYGENIRVLRGMNDEEYNTMIENLKGIITTNEKDFKDCLVSDYKKMLTEIAKTGHLVTTYPRNTAQQQQEKSFLCERCTTVKPKSEFRAIAGDAIRTICSMCEDKNVGDRTNAKKAASEFCTKMHEKKKSGPYEKVKLKKENDKMLDTMLSTSVEEKMLEEIDGSGRYFFAGIIKDKDSAQLSHITAQFDAKNKEEAHGKFVLHEEVKGHIIVSIAYEKASFD